MNKRSIFPIFFSVFCLAVLGLVSAIDASGQGRFVNQYSKRQVSAIIAKVETNSTTFARTFDRAMDNSRLNGTPDEDRFNANVRGFENAMDRLRRQFDRSDTWWESRNDVENAIRESQNVNSMMNSLPFRRNIERQWNNLRADINTLANTYDLPGLDGGGWTGGPWNPPGGGSRTRPPAWAQGTWYWTNGPDRTLTIANNGSVTLYSGGRTSYGTYRRNTITLDGVVSTVTRAGNNIRTYNQSSGETSDYSRSNSGGGFPPGGEGTSRPPNWAQGTWYWVGGPDRRMTIASNGRVTLVTGGRTSYGSYYNETITLDGVVSTVTRAGNRIRTYNQASGETSEYRRR